MVAVLICSRAAGGRRAAAIASPKHDLKARPVYHRKRESIDAHLSVVFAALAVAWRAVPIARAACRVMAGSSDGLRRC